MEAYSLAGSQPCRSRFAGFAVLPVIFVVFLLCFAAFAVFAGFLLRGGPAGQASWAGRQAGWSWQADLDVGPDLKLHGWCWQEAGWAGRQACQTAY